MLSWVRDFWRNSSGIEHFIFIILPWLVIVGVVIYIAKIVRSKRT